MWKEHPLRPAANNINIQAPLCICIHISSAEHLGGIWRLPKTKRTLLTSDILLLYLILFCLTRAKHKFDVSNLADCGTTNANCQVCVRATSQVPQIERENYSHRQDSRGSIMHINMGALLYLNNRNNSTSQCAPICLKVMFLAKLHEIILMS